MDDDLTLFICGWQRAEIIDRIHSETGKIKPAIIFGPMKDNGEISNYIVRVGGYMLTFESVEQKTMFIMKYI